MAAVTPGAIREFHEQVVSHRKLSIDFCLGLERKDTKYAAALIKDMDRISDIFDSIYLVPPDEEPPRQSWPPELDCETFRKRFFADFSPAPGDADIRYWLARAAGTVDHPIGSSLHGQILDVFRSLFVASHDPDCFYLLQVSDDDPEELKDAVRDASDGELAEIGHAHREQLEKITPELLRAEADTACRLSEKQQQGSVSGSDREQSGGSLRSSAVEVLLGEDDRAILEIAHSDDTVDKKMRDICGKDKRHLALSSPEWAALLGVKGGAIRKTKFWKVDRRAAIEAERR
jgi:hypothetical protein